MLRAATYTPKDCETIKNCPGKTRVIPAPLTPINNFCNFVADTYRD